MIHAACTALEADAMNSYFVQPSEAGYWIVTFDSAVVDGPFTTKREAMRLAKRYSPTGRAAVLSADLQQREAGK